MEDAMGILMAKQGGTGGQKGARGGGAKDVGNALGAKGGANAMGQLGDARAGGCMGDAKKGLGDSRAKGIVVAGGGGDLGYSREKGFGVGMRTDTGAGVAAAGTDTSNKYGSFDMDFVLTLALIFAIANLIRVRRRTLHQLPNRARESLTLMGQR
ncbi:unnamed protein product [Ilex paraguariensis]|uniref:Glycine-rich protein n=1 Tax=Ilex paraguariensis TaxID=185542 RepID=A0ABC8TP42_9AQUA